MILRLTLKRFKADRLRFVFMLIAIAAVIALVLVLEGFRAGIYQQIRHIITSRGADIIVSQAGISNMIASRSVLPQLSRQWVEEIEGVSRANPLTTLPVIYNHSNRRTPVFVIVYDTLGGPKQIAQGRGIEQSREIVIDKSLAVIYQLRVGDEFILSDYRFRIAGISENTAAFFAPFAFITYDDLLDLYFESDIVGDISTLPLLSFLLVEIRPGYSAAAVAGQIEKQIPEVDAWLPQTLAANDVDMSREMLGTVFQLMIVIAYVISVLVISMIMFSSIQNRVHELSVFKAMGFNRLRLARAVILETLILTLLSLPLASVFAWLMADLIETVAPVYLILSNQPELLLRTLVAALIFALLGAILSLRTVFRLDPAMAFRGS